MCERKLNAKKNILNIKDGGGGDKLQNFDLAKNHLTRGWTIK